MSREAAPRKSGLRRLVAGFTAGFFTLLILGMIGAGGALYAFRGAGPEAAQGDFTVVVLRRGAGLNEISAALERAGVVRSSSLFSAAAQLTGAARDLKAGEYEFASRAPMGAVLDKIRRGDVVRHFVTVPEGYTSEMAVEVLMAKDILTGSAPVPPEGSILPETYEVTRGEDRGAVLARMMLAHDELLARLWAQRAPGLPFNAPEEAVILASIVEKETGVASERPRIARVFINRLEQGMRLQSDPTIIYGISRGRALGRGIRASEILAPTAHNTYVIDGLPPTPIANPGREALAAVLAPPPGDDLYFVADGTGGHVFGRTLEEHNANVVRWRGIEAARAAEAAAAVQETE